MRLPIKRFCPHCGKKLDAALPIADTGELQPKPGDYTLCFGCCGYLEFTKTGFKKLNINKIKNVQIRRELKQAMEYIKKLHAHIPSVH